MFTNSSQQKCTHQFHCPKMSLCQELHKMGREFSSFIFPSNSITPQIPGQSFQRANPMSLAQRWSVVVVFKSWCKHLNPFICGLPLMYKHYTTQIYLRYICMTTLQASQILISTFNMYFFLTPSRLRKRILVAHMALTQI